MPAVVPIGCRGSLGGVLLSQPPPLHSLLLPCVTPLVDVILVPHVLVEEQHEQHQERLERARVPVQSAARHLLRLAEAEGMPGDVGALPIADGAPDESDLSLVTELFRGPAYRPRVGKSERGGKITAKILQTDIVECFLLRIPGTKEYTCLQCTLPSRIMVWDTLTGEALYVSMKEAVPIPLKEQTMSLPGIFKGLLSQWDRGKPCMRLNKLKQWYHPNVAHLDSGLCTTHCIHTVQGFVMETCHNTITLLVSCLLVERGAGNVQKLRKALKQVLIASARPRRNVKPPSEHSPALEQRNRVLAHVFYDADENLESLHRITMIKHCFQTDISLEEIDVYVGNLLPTEFPRFIEEWATVAVEALMPRGHKFFCRYRWVLSLNPLLEFALLMSICGLLKRAAPLFIASLHGQASYVARAAAAPAAAVADDKGEAAGGGGFVGDLAVVAVEDNAGEVVAEDIEQAGQDADVLGDVSEAYRKQNARAQHNFLLFAESDVCLPEILLLTVTMQCLNRLMQHALYVGSDIWEKRERVKLKTAGSRTYPLWEALSGNVTSAFYDACTLRMMNASFWTVLIGCGRSARMRSMAFSHLAMQIGGVCFFLDFVWSKPPWRYLRHFMPGFVASAQERREAAEGPQCLWDVFWHSFRQQFPGKKWQGSDARMVVHVYVTLWLLGINMIECRHAALRRLCLFKGNHMLTHFMDVAADFYLMRCRTIEERCAMPQPRPWQEELAGPEKSYTCRGGAQRAFMADWWHFKRGTTAEGWAR